MPPPPHTWAARLCHVVATLRPAPSLQIPRKKQKHASSKKVWRAVAFGTIPSACINVRLASNYARSIGAKRNAGGICFKSRLAESLAVTDYAYFSKGGIVAE